MTSLPASGSMTPSAPSAPSATSVASVSADDDGATLSELWLAVRQRWMLLLLGPLLAALMAYGITTLLPPTYSARLVLLPPQQAQSGVSAALASLGQLGALAGGSGLQPRNSVEQLIGLMRSTTVSDRLIDQFKLMEVYDRKFRVDAHKRLGENVRISSGKKDGLLTVEVDDRDPKRAADIANRYVDELRSMLSVLAVTEAQQRRKFFEEQLKQSKQQLTTAQQSLQESGFNSGALKAEPRAAAEAYAKLRAEVAAAQIRLQVMRTNLADGTPEVQQQMRSLEALRGQLAKQETTTDLTKGPDYISRYREFKYQETLFELYARQFELARVDESRESNLIQVIDFAKPPEKKSRPVTALVVGLTLAISAFVLLIFVLVRHFSRTG